MSMLQSLMSSVMSASKPSGRSGPEKEDPITKENRAATRKFLEGIAKENKPELIEAYRSTAAQYGIDLSPYQASAGIITAIISVA